MNHCNESKKELTKAADNAQDIICVFKRRLQDQASMGHTKKLY